MYLTENWKEIFENLLTADTYYCLTKGNVEKCRNKTTNLISMERIITFCKKNRVLVTLEFIRQNPSLIESYHYIIDENFTRITVMKNAT